MHFVLLWVLVGFSTTNFTRAWEPTLSWNQFHALTVRWLALLLPLGRRKNAALWFPHTYVFEEFVEFRIFENFSDGGVVDVRRDWCITLCGSISGDSHDRSSGLEVDHIDFVERVARFVMDFKILGLVDP